METPRNDFGNALSVDADAVGEPGRRRFRLLVRSTSQSAAIWMEKEQLAGIGTWFAEMSERLDSEQPSSDPDVEPLPFGGSFDLDFRASQIGLGYLDSESAFVIQAFNGDEAEESSLPFFRAHLSRGQCRVLSHKIALVVAAGRQICPLCEMPMDPAGHVCPKSNGHAIGVG